MTQRLGSKCDPNNSNTFHIFFALIYDESIPSVRFSLRANGVFNNADLKNKENQYLSARIVMSWNITLSMGPKRPNSRSRSDSFTS